MKFKSFWSSLQSHPLRVTLYAVNNPEINLEATNPDLQIFAGKLQENP